MRFGERLRRLEALEAGRQDAESGADVLCVRQVDWDALQSPTTDATARQAIDERYGVDANRFPGKVYVGICLCWSGRSCPVCEDVE